MCRFLFLINQGPKKKKKKGCISETIFFLPNKFLYFLFSINNYYLQKYNLSTYTCESVFIFRDEIRIMN